MNLLLLSSDPISIPCLDALAEGRVEGLSLAGVVTNPDRRSGRGKRLQRNPVAAAADRHGIPLAQAARLRAGDLEGFAACDGVLVFAFGQILPRRVLALRPGGFLNFHTSPLPELRGPSPIETAIAEGRTRTEICLMEIVPRMDAGPVIARRPVPIRPDDTGASLRETLAREAVRLLGTVPAALRGELPRREQDETRATWCRMIGKADALLDFSLPARALADRSRAFAGWPGSAIRAGGETIRVEGVRPVEAAGRPGQILEAGGRLVVAAGEGAVAIGSLQRPTRKLLPWPEFRKSFPLRPGTLLSYPLSRPLVRGNQARLRPVRKERAPARNPGTDLDSPSL
ncbi:MAG: methionyl-tRNA formyltransferase [Puniceicoccaceae bacterium]